MSKIWPPLQHYVEIDWVGGSHTLLLTADQARRYAADPGPVVAEVLGCGLDAYLTWLEWQGRAQCVAMTGKRKRCRSTVPGVSFDQPSGLAEHGGGYCTSHGTLP